jgi:hypothetical protein
MRALLFRRLIFYRSASKRTRALRLLLSPSIPPLAGDNSL